MELTREKYLNLRPVEDSCKQCSNIIWYPHTLIIDKNDSLCYVNGTYQTTKKIGDSQYSLSICYLCLCKKFPEITLKKSSKLFNTCNKYVKEAFLVSDYDFNKQKKKHGVTLEKMISLYGREDGERRWAEYCEKQKITNLFEYKSQKFGWTQKQFKEFNQSRSVTKNNLISKYGEKLGIEKWNQYIVKQKYTKSLQYLIEKYGIHEGHLKYLDINKAKALTLSNYISKFGKSNGTEKFKQIVLKRDSYFSKISQSFFSELDNRISHLNLTTYYHNKNGEFGKGLSNINRYSKLDFYISEINLAIEYNGDYWHANPKFYKCSDILYNNQMAKDIWKTDELRQSALFTEHSIETIVVWQYDDLCNRDKKINELIYEIEKRI